MDVKNENRTRTPQQVRRTQTRKTRPMPQVSPNADGLQKRTPQRQNVAQAQARMQARAAQRKRRYRMQLYRRLALLTLCVGIGLFASGWLLLGDQRPVQANSRAQSGAQENEVVGTSGKGQYTIVLDSGHSTYNVGAHGLVKEEAVTAKTTEALRALFEQDENYTVVLTHEYDVHADIAARRQVGIDTACDFFISIHCNINGEDSTVSGFEVYPQLPENPHHDESYAVAQSIARAFVDEGHTPRIGSGILYCRYVTDANGQDVQYTLTEQEEATTDYGGETFGVIKSEEYAGLLIEQGYVASATDVANWMSDDGTAKAARIYYEAVCDYFGTQAVG